ncbi:MAG: DUF1801 domain-containing protein [Phycisphaeraceae bacterium]|nr:DUF1801 domain-containing protein [Phycisphaeraceae bacterium]
MKKATNSRAKGRSARSPSGDATASSLIDARIESFGDWRGAVLARLRTLIREADPAIVEEVKWRKPSNSMLGVPVWSRPTNGRAGIICTGETYKDKVKLTFASGAALDDPSGLFNASLDGGTRRAIDLHEGDTINARAFKALIRAAAALTTPPTAEKSSRRASAASRPRSASANPVNLLSGGNPQIPKADGDAPVQDYIQAMPGWKRQVGRRLDHLIVQTLPGVRKAVRWNTPFYGIEGRGWFLAFHCFDRYVKVTFFRGTSLAPMPPVGSKTQDVRYAHIHEHESLDETVWTGWIRQAASLPGEACF